MGEASRPSSAIFLVVFGVLCASAGVLMGRLTVSASPMALRPDTRPGVPVVHLSRVGPGALEATASGQVRLMAGPHVAVPTQDGRITLALPASVFALPSQKDAQFIASLRGRTYYPLSSPQGQDLSPENRLYFADALSAACAGYAPGR